MADTCSCGAQLPPDSWFCNKCGKPQREIETPEIERNAYLEPPPDSIILPAAPVQLQPAPPPLNFRNPIAMRIAVLAALSAVVLAFLPFLNYFLAGFFAVFFYRRRTGALLTMESGVRMGWMTGLLTFSMLVALTAIAVLVIRSMGGIAALQTQLKMSIDPKYLEAFKTLLNFPELMGQLAFLFVFVTCLSMAGGALGAKMAGRS